MIDGIHSLVFEPRLYFLMFIVEQGFPHFFVDCMLAVFYAEVVKERLFAILSMLELDGGLL